VRQEGSRERGKGEIGLLHWTDNNAYKLRRESSITDTEQREEAFNPGNTYMGGEIREGSLPQNIPKRDKEDGQQTVHGRAIQGEGGKKGATK